VFAIFFFLSILPYLPVAAADTSILRSSALTVLGFFLPVGPVVFCLVFLFQVGLRIEQW